VSAGGSGGTGGSGGAFLRRRSHRTPSVSEGGDKRLHSLATAIIGAPPSSGVAAHVAQGGNHFFPARRTFEGPIVLARFKDARGLAPLARPSAA
jgi:hypothetical protein